MDEAQDRTASGESSLSSGKINHPSKTHPTDQCTDSTPSPSLYDEMNENLQYKTNHFVITVLASIGILPKSMVDVHNMLVSVATSLVEGGELGIFSPMYMVVMQKPKAK